MFIIKIHVSITNLPHINVFGITYYEYKMIFGKRIRHFCKYFCNYVCIYVYINLI